MKVTLSNLGEEFLQNYKLVKKIDNNFINETIEGDVIFDGEKHGYLVEAAINGFEIETGNVSEQCKELTFTKAVKLSHKDGSFDFKKCRTTKQIKFNSPLDCVAEGEVNIFDYTASETESIQGVLDTDSYSQIVYAFLEYDGDQLNLSLNYLLSFLAPIPDKTNIGFYERIKRIIVLPWTSGDTFQIVLQVSYIRNRSSIQHTPKWQPIPGTSEYFLPFGPIFWGTPEYDVPIGTDLTAQYAYVKHQAGQFVNFQDLTISNTVNFKS